MHVGLFVSDIDETILFYNKFFGIEPLKIKANYAKYELVSPALVISFVVDRERVSSNFGHLGIQVNSSIELKDKIELIQNEGLEYTEENQVSCCYALQDKIWVSDPDGIRWEVYQFHEDVETNDAHEATTCCSSKINEKDTCCEADAQCC